MDVVTGALGELMVDLAEFGWFPRSLPSGTFGNDDVGDEEDEELGAA